jgi:hypothetical protein
MGAVTLGLAAITATTGPASGQANDTGTFDESDSFQRECDTMTLDIGVRDVGRYVVRVNSAGDELGTVVETHTETITNPATDKTMVVVIKGLWGKDQSIVRNADGTSSLTNISTSRLVAYGPDGTRAYSGSGLSTYVLTFDEEGEFDSFEGDFVGHLDWNGTCTAAEALLS